VSVGAVLVARMSPCCPPGDYQYLWCSHYLEVTNTEDSASHPHISQVILDVDGDDSLGVDEELHHD